MYSRVAISIMARACIIATFWLGYIRHHIYISSILLCFPSHQPCKLSAEFTPDLLPWERFGCQGNQVRICAIETRTNQSPYNLFTRQHSSDPLITLLNQRKVQFAKDFWGEANKRANDGLINAQNLLCWITLRLNQYWPTMPHVPIDLQRNKTCYIIWGKETRYRFCGRDIRTHKTDDENKKTNSYLGAPDSFLVNTHCVCLCAQ